MKNKIKVAELFAGVGGFRLGLEGWKNQSASSNYRSPLNSPYEVVWSNQWEPSTKSQHASEVYESRFGKQGHSNQDIAAVIPEQIPNHDLLVGGFPCQDYSVATTLKNAKGLIGKKGVLWWSIHKILSEKQPSPTYLFLENVDRLLISPSSQRGRDFAIILRSLCDLGFAVEWRVINAAEYGMPQRRRRTFILAYHSTTPIFQTIKKMSSTDWVLEQGTIAEAFPVNPTAYSALQQFQLSTDLVDVSNGFNKMGNKSPFENAGLMIDGVVTTMKTIPEYDGPQTFLRDVLQSSDVPPEFYINEQEFPNWQYLKGAKKEVRKNAEGYEYNYAEGGMVFPDALDKPSRTIITGEGGKSPSRFKHVIQTENGYRRLSPIELERLNMFPDEHTKHNGVSDTKRAFFMGNALVVGVVERIGKILGERIQ